MIARRFLADSSLVRLGSFLLSILRKSEISTAFFSALCIKQVERPKALEIALIELPFFLQIIKATFSLGVT